MRIESDEVLRVLEGLRVSARHCVEETPSEAAIELERHRAAMEAYEQAIDAVHASMLHEKAPKGMQAFLNVRQRTRPEAGLPKNLHGALRGGCSDG